MILWQQIITLFVLAIPVACVSWTVTHEEIFREPREHCLKKSRSAKSLWTRKFAYLFTCEYCFSHYVATFFLILTRYKLIYTDYRGYVISLFALVWISNIYMSLFGLIKIDIKSEKLEVEIKEKQKEEIGL